MTDRDIERRIQRAHERLTRLEKQQEGARDDLALVLLAVHEEHGWSYSRIGRVIGVSAQRAHQIAQRAEH